MHPFGSSCKSPSAVPNKQSPAIWPVLDRFPSFPSPSLSRHRHQAAPQVLRCSAVRCRVGLPMPAHNFLLARPYEHGLPFAQYIGRADDGDSCAALCRHRHFYLHDLRSFLLSLYNILFSAICFYFYNILVEQMTETHREALFARVAPHQLHVHSPECLGREARSPPGKPYEAALIFSAHGFDYLHVQ